MTRFLLIDNDAARRELMASELREHGFDVEEHDNLNIESISGAEAIAADSARVHYRLAPVIHTCMVTHLTISAGILSVHTKRW